LIVVDTNILAYLYIQGERSCQVESLLAADSNWCAPVLWRSEFRSVLGLYLRKALLSLEEVLLIIDQAEKLLIDNEYELPPANIMRLVNESNCSAYDCEFVALAQFLRVPLVTEDRKILMEFPGVAVSVTRFLGN
jgi:predicted nucleic acid-binding protein